MSLSWGPFSEVGLAAEMENRGQRMAHQGIDSLTPAEGTTLLAALLAHPRASAGLVRISMRQWIESHPQAAGMRYLADLEAEEATSRAPAGGSFADRLAGATAAEREAMILEHLVEQVSRVLRLDPSRVERGAPFTSLGMDSLMSLELRNRLEASLGLRLSAALLFTYASPGALADYLFKALSPAEEAPKAPEAAAKAPVVEEPAAPAAPGAESAAVAPSTSPVEAASDGELDEGDAAALAELAELEEFLR
ncbi:MAG: beta-ketoacyl reductase [Polyangiaceae bacterium]